MKSWLSVTPEAGIRRVLMLGALLGLVERAGAVSPLTTDDADTVERGRLQLGWGLDYLQQQPARRVALPLNLIYGVADRGEVGVSWGYQWHHAGGNEDGWLDTALGTKWKWWADQERGISLGLRGDLKLPSARKSAGLGTGETDAGVTFVATKTWGATAFDFNLGYSALDVGGGSVTDDELFLGQSLRHALSERWSLVGEITVRIPTGDRRRPVWGLNGGCQFSVTENLVAELAVGTGWNRNSPDLTGYAGLTWVL